METPSQEILNAANVSATVTDARGRKIGIRRPKLLDKMRLFEIIGAENAMNGPYLGVAMLAIWVVSIDGDDVARCKTKLAVEALVQRIEDDGSAAVSKWIEENIIEAQLSADEAKAALKNE